ncbi:MAG: hypothetical protein AB7X49_25175 [Geminicoccaceae bacterium]
MERFGSLATAALVLAAGLVGGCSGGGSGLTTGSLFGGPSKPQVDPVVGITNEDPMARPVQVAWTAARATKCGFNFDAAKLKMNYLAYERSQGTPADQMARIETTYDTSYRTIWSKIAPDPNFCTDSKSTKIKEDLQRHLAGNYTPDLPKPKVVASGGLFDTDGQISEKPFEGKDFWQKQRDNGTGR